MMNKQETMKKAEEICQDTEFMEKLRTAQSAEEMAELFASKGIETTAEEIDSVMGQVANDGSDELDEATLENVAGGCAFLIGCILYSIADVGWSIHCYNKAKKKAKG